MTEWGNIPWAAEPTLIYPPASSVPGTNQAAFETRLGGALVWIAEIEAALNGGTVPTGGDAWSAVAYGEEPTAFSPAAGFDTLRISDMGWKSAPTDVAGVVPYPPLLRGGPNIERRVSLSPFALDTYAWGSLGIAPSGGIPTVSLSNRDTALRRVRLRAGVKGYDSARGYTIDPPATALLDVFTGVGMTWQASEGGIELPLRDPSAWLSASIGIRKFLGTGGAEGPTELAGRPWPIVRGGTVADPVRACPVVLVNAASSIYRWTDVGIVTALYEDGSPVYTNAGSVPDVFGTTPSAGTFIHDPQGQVRLGSAPQGNITVDGYSGSAILVASVLKDFLLNTLAIPAIYLDDSSFLATAGAVNYTGGWAWSGEETGVDAVQPLLAALGARLVASRSGGLKLWPLRALTSSAVAVQSFDIYNTVSIVPVPLSSPLTPPSASWTVGYMRTHSTTTTLKPTVSVSERERWTKEYRTATWSDSNNLLRYAQAARPDIVPTALLRQTEAAALAQAYGNLWGVPRSLWQVTVPTGSALLRDIGDVVQLTWPIEGLSNGVLGQVVGDSIRAGEQTASILVLV